jgi:hypothetical protein
MNVVRRATCLAFDWRVNRDARIRRTSEVRLSTDSGAKLDMHVGPFRVQAV